MSLARDGWALPENTVVVPGSKAVSYYKITKYKMAGVAGLEPANHGIKTRCLTTWLHPIQLCPYCPAGKLFSSKCLVPSHQ